jgi:hypothetical protein
VVGPEFLKEMEEKMLKIKQNLKDSQDRQKSYVDKNRTHGEFKVGEHVFLKVKANRSSLRLEKCSKLAARFCGPFEILEWIGPVAYMLALPASMIVHNVFHISLIKKYIPDANHVIDWNVIQVEQEGVLKVHMMHILDQKRKQLWNRAIGTTAFGSNSDGAFDAIATFYCRKTDKPRTPSNVVSQDVVFPTT